MARLHNRCTLFKSHALFPLRQQAGPTTPHKGKSKGNVGRQGKRRKIDHHAILDLLEPTSKSPRNLPIPATPHPSPVIPCPRHASSTLTLFCIQDQEPVCDHCLQTTHFGHACQSLPDAAQDMHRSKAIPQLIREASEKISRLEQNRQYFMLQPKEFLLHEQNIQKQITSRFADIRQQLEEREKVLLAELASSISKAVSIPRDQCILLEAKESILRRGKALLLDAASMRPTGAGDACTTMPLPDTNTLFLAAKLKRDLNQSSAALWHSFLPPPRVSTAQPLSLTSTAAAMQTLWEPPRVDRASEVVFLKVNEEWIHDLPFCLELISPQRLDILLLVIFETQSVASLVLSYLGAAQGNIRMVLNLADEKLLAQAFLGLEQIKPHIISMAVGQDLLWVICEGMPRILGFSLQSGQWVKSIRRFLNLSRSPTQREFVRISSIVIDPAQTSLSGEEELFISRSHEHTILVISTTTHELLRTIGSPADDDTSISSSVQHLALSSEHVFLLETNTNRVTMYAKEGTPIRRWGAAGSIEESFCQPAGITVSGHEIFITQQGSKRLQVWSFEGVYLRGFGWDPAIPRLHLFHPRGVGVIGEQLYVCDSINNRVLLVNKDTFEYLGEWGPNYQAPEMECVPSPNACTSTSTSNSYYTQPFSSLLALPRCGEEKGIEAKRKARHKHASRQPRSSRQRDDDDSDSDTEDLEQHSKKSDKEGSLPFSPGHSALRSPSAMAVYGRQVVVAAKGERSSDHVCQIFLFS